GSSVVVIKSLGLFKSRYTGFSGLRILPWYLTVSFLETLKPNSFTTVPLTLIKPFSIRVSASRREETPALAMYLFKRISSSALFLLACCSNFLRSHLGLFALGSLASSRFFEKNFPGDLRGRASSFLTVS